MIRKALLAGLCGLFIVASVTPADAGIFRRRRSSNCSYNARGWRNRVSCASGACSTVSAKQVVQKEQQVQKSQVQKMVQK